MERQIINPVQEKSPGLRKDGNSGQDGFPDWRTAMKELRELVGGGASLEDEFLKQRRSEKW